MNESIPYYCRVALTVVHPTWKPRNESVRQTVTRTYDALWVRPYWQAGCRWIGRALAVVGLLSLLGLVNCSSANASSPPPLPQWMELCGPDFVSFVGRRWLLSSNAVDESGFLDELNFWTVQKRSILSVRAFQYGDELRAFVAVDLGNHRLSDAGKPVDIVISGEGYKQLMICLAKSARP